MANYDFESWREVQRDTSQFSSRTKIGCRACNSSSRYRVCCACCIMIAYQSSACGMNPPQHLCPDNNLCQYSGSVRDERAKP